MATPKGMRSRSIPLQNRDQVMIYSNEEEIFLQLRHEVPTEVDITAPSVKVGVALTTDEALSLAAELLSVVNSMLKRAKKETHPGQ
jgi:hypothetical protein